MEPEASAFLSRQGQLRQMTLARSHSRSAAQAGGILVVVAQLFRSMKLHNGHPLIARSARALGVRIGEDVKPDGQGIIHPGAGMSVAPDDPLYLPDHRRPEEYGGSGPDPVWAIERDDWSTDDLSYVADRIEHGVIGPARTMQLDAYENALADTQNAWKLLL